MEGVGVEVGSGVLEGAGVGSIEGGLGASGAAGALGSEGAGGAVGASGALGAVGGSRAKAGPAVFPNTITINRNDVINLLTIS